MDIAAEADRDQQFEDADWGILRLFYKTNLLF